MKEIFFQRDPLKNKVNKSHTSRKHTASGCSYNSDRMSGLTKKLNLMKQSTAAKLQPICLRPISPLDVATNTKTQAANPAKAKGAAASNTTNKSQEQLKNAPM